MNRLAQMSEGQSIFAATVCRFVSDEPQVEDAFKTFTYYNSATTLSLLPQ